LPVRQAGVFSTSLLLQRRAIDMKLVVGLGNPGREHEGTRHNAGYWWVDRLAARAGARLRPESRFHGYAGKLVEGGRECWLLKPTTFMNVSGRAVQALTQFYKIVPGDILVVHDELDLPPGEVRLKKGGGSAGHNGLKDITAHLGPDYWRLRIGIGRPPDREQMVNFVLNAPRKEELPLIDDAIERSLDSWPLLLDGKSEAAMLKLHTKV
jgi:PTH1 family peptidyl-tRNA hydrolase